MEFAQVKLGRLRNGINLAAAQRASVQMLGHVPRVAKQAIQDTPKYATLALQNNPWTGQVFNQPAAGLKVPVVP